MNPGTLVILLVLIAVVGGIVYKMVRDRRSGKKSCGGNCGACTMGGFCYTNATFKTHDFDKF